MEFLKSINRKSLASEALYISLNIALAVVSMILIRVTNTPWPALVLMILSRWRVFAVRPRFWIANILSDLVSLIVSLSFVIFLYLANVNVTSGGDMQVLLIQIVLVALYILWLLLLRPQSKRVYVAMQASVALFAGVTAIYALSYALPVSVVVLLMWGVGCSVTRHIISNYDEEAHINFFTLAGGFLMAEIGWVYYHWIIAYDIPATDNLMLPQASVVITSLGFLMYKMYDSYYHNKKIKLNDILLPLIFTILLVLTLLIFFNGVSANSFN